MEVQNIDSGMVTILADGEECAILATACDLAFDGLGGMNEGDTQRFVLTAGSLFKSLAIAAHLQTGIPGNVYRPLQDELCAKGLLKKRVTQS